MIREAVSEDIEGIYHLISSLENREFDFRTFLEIFEGQLPGKMYLCPVDEQDNKIIGVISLRMVAQLHHAGKIAEILEFAVDPDYRSHGIGRSLLARACGAAKENGCLLVEVACNRVRTAAHRFYLREGLQETHFRFAKDL